MNLSEYYLNFTEKEIEYILHAWQSEYGQSLDVGHIPFLDKEATIRALCTLTVQVSPVNLSLRQTLLRKMDTEFLSFEHKVETITDIKMNEGYNEYGVTTSVMVAHIRRRVGEEWINDTISV